MKKIITYILVMCIIFTSTSPVNVLAKKSKKSVWPSGPDVVAESAILMEASTGVILYEKNKDDKHYPASITKIMTTILAIENCKLNEIVTFSHDAIFGIERDSTHIGIDVGEKLTVEQCLYAIMLASANEVAYGIAEHVAGNINDFAELMNKKAKEIGCKNTHFINPHGLHDDDHYTSAYDMALIMKEAMKNQLFRKITSTYSYSIPPTNKHDKPNSFSNHHRMLNPYKVEYNPECISGKPGYTSKAGNTLVTVAKRDDLTLICVVMKDNSAGQWNDTKSLLDFGFSNYTSYNIADNEQEETIQNNMFFSRYHALLNKETSPIKIDTNGIVVLPNKVKFSDIKRNVELVPIENLQEGLNIIGKITYDYKDKEVGFTNITYDNHETRSLEVFSENISVKKGKLNKNEITQISKKSFIDTIKGKFSNIRFSKIKLNNLKEKILSLDIRLLVIIIAIIIILILLIIIIKLPRLKARRSYRRRRRKRLKQKSLTDFNLNRKD